MPPRPRGSSEARATAARARRQAQRRTARALRRGEPTLPPRLTEAVRRARQAALSPEAGEARIGGKPLADTALGTLTFGQLHSYSPRTVQFMWEKMTGAQRRLALAATAEEYQSLAREQSAFNVFWYHSNDLDTLQGQYDAANG